MKSTLSSIEQEAKAISLNIVNKGYCDASSEQIDLILSLDTNCEALLILGRCINGNSELAEKYFETVKRIDDPNLYYNASIALANQKNLSDYCWNQWVTRK